MQGNVRDGIARTFLFVCLLGLLLAGCFNSDTADGPLDTSRLPRVAGAKEVFASPQSTIFTSPNSVAQTGDAVEKALADGGWQKYVAPSTTSNSDPNSSMLSLKKGTQAVRVFITIAPAQNTATSVQYGALPLKTDLPFTKDASNVEYSPDRPSLALISAEPIDKTLDFYRKELGARGWSMWSEKTNGKQPADGPSGVVHERGAYAHYITDKDPSVALVLTLQKAEAGKFKVELKEWPVGILASLHQAYLNGDNSNTPPVDVAKLPRLEGAREQTERSSQDRLVYSVPGSVENTIAAAKKLLAADGWKQYVAPLEETHTTLLAFKKGGQGLSVSFTMTAGQADQSSVYYSPTRLRFALPFPEDATDIVFDDNRPYLNLTASRTADSNLDLFQKVLIASGWSPLSAADAAAKWPNANIGEKPLSGARAYFSRGNLKPIVLSVQSQGDKSNVEIKVAPFAEPQALEAAEDIFGLPRPKLTKTAGGTGGQTEREVHAQVPAGVGTVLAFYRRELSARNWKEEAEGAVVNPEEVRLNFSFAEGTAVLKLGHQYDLTTVSLAQKITTPAVSSEPAAKDDTIDAMVKQAQQMVRDATADAMVGEKSQKTAQIANEPAEALRPLAGSDAPVPLPDTATDVEFDGDGGKLEFSSSSSIKSVAEFYRSIMKQQGWGAQPSVINNANMVVLDFSKANKSVSFTIMKMGGKTNVSVDGSALKGAAAKPATLDAPSGKVVTTDTPSQPATDDDLIAEESGGLPVPKRHTMAVGDKSPFRRELNANVPLNVADVLGFYRRELGKLNWKEESAGAVVAPDNVRIAFSSAEGPGLLKLGRKDGETTVNLVTKNPDAAAKAGIVAKPGQAKLLISNPNDVEAVMTINKQAIKVAAGSGIKGPDGTTLDLTPGKYKFSIKLPGKPASDDEIEVAADETWGVFIGPGGALPVHVY